MAQWTTPSVVPPEFTRLIERSFFACPGREANLQIHRVATERAPERATERGVSYEVVLTGRSWRWVVEVVLPRLTYHLRCVNVARLSPRAVLPCFFGDALFFLTAADLIDAVQREERWTDEELRQKLARWERGEAYPESNPTPRS